MPKPLQCFVSSILYPENPFGIMLKARVFRALGFCTGWHPPETFDAGWEGPCRMLASKKCGFDVVEACEIVLLALVAFWF